MTGGRVPLDDALSSAELKAQYVRRLFSTIADRYDLITVLLSFGLDARWKRRVVRLADPRPGQRALDLACGTGDIAFALAARGAHVIGLDITHRMLLLGRARVLPPALDDARAREGESRERVHQGRGTMAPVFVGADMVSLPFPDASVDIVTTGYGLRNVPDLEGALNEISRVVRRGGTLVSLDFNRPSSAVVRGIYLSYLWLVGGVLGWILHRDPDTYRYIPASIERYPGAATVTAMIRRAGFTSATWLPVLGGLMAIHVARK